MFGDGQQDRGEGGHQEDHRRLRARLGRDPHPPRGEAPPRAEASRHRGGQAHRPPAQPARVQGHLRHLRAHGDRLTPGHQGERRPHARAPPVLPLPGTPRHTFFTTCPDLSDDRNGSHHKWVPDVTPEPLTTR